MSELNAPYFSKSERLLNMVEGLQLILNWGRQGDPLDVVSNTLGTLAGLAAYHWLLNKSPLKYYF